MHSGRGAGRLIEAAMKSTPTVRIAVVAGVALAAVLVFLTLRPAPTSSRSRLVVVDLEVSAGHAAQLYWSDELGFSEERSARAPLQPGVPQRLRFVIPGRGVRWLRLDPTDAAGEIVIRRFELVGERGQTQAIPPLSLRPASQVASLGAIGDALRVETLPGADNPYLYAPIGCLEPGALGVATPFTLFLVSALVVALVGAAAMATVRSGAAAPLPAPGIAALWFGALIALTFAAKLLLMRAMPVLTPFWDQWDAEAAYIFAPFDACSLSWRTMFGLHNEHRIFFSRLLALDLLALNGQWDPRLEQVVNAALHTLTAALIASMWWIAAGRKRLDLVVVTVTLACALPFSWENTLLGFQSAFYFLLLFSMLGIWLATTQPVGTMRWLIGWACAACAIFTAASGLLAAVAIGAISTLRVLGERSRLREQSINVAIGLVLFGVGYAVSSPPLPGHEVLRVRTVSELFTAAGRSLAWPWIFRPGLAVIGWLPMILVTGGILRRRFQSTALERFTLALGGWVAMHAVALAYGRGAGGGIPATRYMDFLSLGFVANAMALTCLLDRVPEGTKRRTAVATALAAWLIFSIAGLNGLVRESSLVDLSAWRQFFASHTELVRRFVIGGDRSSIAGKAPMQQLPYPDADLLLMRLQDPYIRRILPAAVRAPIRVAPAMITENSFALDATYDVAARDPLVPSWGSYSARANAAEGRFESEPIAPCTAGRVLRFDVAGHLGFDDHLLAVRDVRTGREDPAVRSGPVRNGWSTATVACPEGPFTIVAVDHSRWSWFAFRPPVEIGTASIAAERVIDAAWPLLLAGVILLGVAARWT